MSLSNPRYLLIVACSQRKRSDPGLLPAITRYDGGQFRVLRKAQRDGYLPECLDVLILSAKYGLIEASTPIADYEQRMNRKRASELKAQVTQALGVYDRKNIYTQVYVDLGQDYRPAVKGLTELFKGSQVTLVEGRIGERLRQLKLWLTEKCGENNIHIQGSNECSS
jgi:hypothetical protein